MKKKEKKFPFQKIFKKKAKKKKKTKPYIVMHWYASLNYALACFTKSELFRRFKLYNLSFK